MSDSKLNIIMEREASTELAGRSSLVSRGIAYLNSLSNPNPKLLWSFHGYGEKKGTGPGGRPFSFSVLPEHIPQELVEWRQWICWDFAWRDGRWRKSPVSPINGSLASELDASVWGSFDEAYAFACHHQLSGIGFVLSAEDPYVGVDLDDCRDENTGKIKAWALRIITLLDSYAEVSPSGTGVHILVRGTLPPATFYRPQSGYPEVYDRNQYLTFTGRRFIEVPESIEYRQEGIEETRSTLVNSRPSPMGQIRRWPSIRDMAISKDTILISTWDNCISALDPQTGRHKWYMQRSPVQHDLCLTINQHSFLVRKGDYLSSLDAEIGEERWRFQVEGPFVYASAHRGMAYIRELVRDGVECQHSRVSAVDAESGAVLWQVQTPAGFSDPIPYDETLWVQNSDDLMMLDASTGETHLHYPTLQTTVVRRTAESLIWQSEDSVSALDFATGQLLWHSHDWHDSLLSAASSSVVVLSGNGDVHNAGFEHVLDAISGEFRWSRPCRDEDTRLFLSKSLVELAFVGGETLTAIDARSGATLWRLATEAKPRLLSDNNGILFAVDGASLIAVDALSGRLLWTLPVFDKDAGSRSLGEIASESTPRFQVHDSTIYIVADHVLFAIAVSK
jgi:outer membrane protein assembly factor BamB